MEDVYQNGYFRVMIAVTTDIIGKRREIKARYSDRKERGLKSDYT